MQRAFWTPLASKGHFDFIFDIVASEHIPKPNPQPYDLFVEQSGIVPQTSVMIEDMARNLEPAAALGMQTIWLVSDHDRAAKGAERIILSILLQKM